MVLFLLSIDRREGYFFEIFWEPPYPKSPPPPPRPFFYLPAILLPLAPFTLPKNFPHVYACFLNWWERNSFYFICISISKLKYLENWS